MNKIHFSILLSVISYFQCYSQVVINEIFASNISAFFEKSTFNYACYVEFYNKGNLSVNISGYYLTNNATNPKLWQLPGNSIIQSKGYFVVYCDELNISNHTNFRLDADGGKIILSDKGNQVVDSLTYGKQFYDLPFGQKPDGSGKWTRLAKPTHKSSNNSIQSSTQICPKPTITPQAGFYNSTVNVSIAANLVNAQVRYTTNGSEPTINSQLYTSPFTVNSNTVVKARSFHSDYLPGTTACNSFLINQHKSSLPVMSVSLNPGHLTDDSIGIYVVGKNGIEGNCYGKTNWNRDWERPAVIEYFDASGTLLLSQGVDLKIAGGCSRTEAQKSLALMASSRYGSGNLDYPFFASRPYKKGYGSLLLRNSGNDFKTTKFRDALIQELCINQMDVDYQAYQPVAVYLNGTYWGLMNLREKVDKSYLRINQSLPLDSVIMLERNGESILGSNTSFNSFIDSIKLVDMSTDAGYNLLDRHIDINEYLNYLVVEIYSVNTDWPGNNIKFWKSVKPGSKWRWILTDLDFGFGLYGRSPMDSTLNFVTETNGPNWPNPPWSTLLIRKVFENPVTRSMFIQKMQTAINTVFNKDRVNEKIDSIKNYIAPEMAYHWNKYGSNAVDWNKNIEAMRNFTNARGEFMAWHLKDFFKLSDSYTEITIKNTDKEKADYYFNQIRVHDTLPNQFSAQHPVIIEAKPLPGYFFDRWNVKKYKIEKVELIHRGSIWKYYDNNTDKLSADWKNIGFNDSLWLSGPAELGYGDNDEKTILQFGGNSSNKYITSVYRKKFKLDNLGANIKLKGEVLYDDGAVVYLNGKEILRTGMPSGDINYNTLASTSREDDDLFQSFDIPSELLKTGENIVAVEIHQNSSGSSDISFDFSLSFVNKEFSGTSTFDTERITGTFNESMELTALYKNAEPVNNLVINEIAASNKTLPDNRGDCEDWIEIYNGGEKTVDLGRVFIDYKGTKNVYRSLYPSGVFNLNPGSFAVFWADDEIDEGPLHLPFKLPGEGETIKLIQPVGNGINLLDSFKIISKNPGLTVGRYPDGKSDWFRMSTITPGNSNIYQSTQTASVNFDNEVSVFPNPAKNYFYVDISKTDIPQFQISLIGSDGRIFKTFNSFKNSEKIDISDISGGYYVLSISNGNWHVLRKIVVIK